MRRNGVSLYRLLGGCALRAFFAEYSITDILLILQAICFGGEGEDFGFESRGSVTVGDAPRPVALSS